MARVKLNLKDKVIFIATTVDKVFTDELVAKLTQAGATIHLSKHLPSDPANVEKIVAEINQLAPSASVILIQSPGLRTDTGVAACMDICREKPLGIPAIVHDSASKPVETEAALKAFNATFVNAMTTRGDRLISAIDETVNPRPMGSPATVALGS